VVDPAHPLAIGRHTLQLVVTDDSGNASAPATAAVVVVDSVAPTAVIDAPARLDVGQTLTASGARSSDIGGRVVGYTWTLDALAPVQTASPTFTFTVSPASPLAWGRHTIQLVVTDDSGNQSLPVSAAVSVVDTAAPSTTATLTPVPRPSGWNNGPVAIALSAVDQAGGSGVHHVTYRIPGTSVQTEVAGASASFVISSRGTTALEVFATDNAGNVEPPRLVTVRIDTTAPVTSANVVTSGSTATVTLSATDDLSGVAETTYTVNDGPPTRYAGPFSVSGPGTFVVRFGSSDLAGNVETRRAEIVPLVSSRTLCASLGAAALPEIDLFSFNATAGESVTVQLNPNPPGAAVQGSAILTLFGPGVAKASTGSVPRTINAGSLPRQATYFVSVSQPIPRAGRFTGDYCVTVVSSGTAAQTFAAR
jgi:hypothetical protein